MTTGKETAAPVGHLFEDAWQIRGMEPLVMDMAMQPECLDAGLVKKQYADKLVLDGTIETQTTMPRSGTLEEVHSVARKRIETPGQGGGRLILSPTHLLEPEVPMKNVVAYIEVSKASTQGEPQ